MVKKTNQFLPHLKFISNQDLDKTKIIQIEKENVNLILSEIHSEEIELSLTFICWLVQSSALWS